ncbi:MAG: hypothetical protein C3F17_00575 [Bradyrhizobiaceae bacterium]|nr:MAG: hypothetical protein C3F17_00575 [Bradyrhizobiaceae bacterium]
MPPIAAPVAPPTTAPPSTRSWRAVCVQPVTATAVTATRRIFRMMVSPGYGRTEDPRDGPAGSPRARLAGTGTTKPHGSCSSETRCARASRRRSRIESSSPGELSEPPVVLRSKRPTPHENER